MSRLGDMIKQERLRAGWTHKQLAKKSGVSESFLMEVDKDKVLKENFVDNQSLLVIIDWTFPGNKDNEEVIQQKLDEFMRKMEQRER